MSQKLRNKTTATPAKLALIGVLALMLICVLASNFGGGADGPVAHASEVEPIGPAAEPAPLAAESSDGTVQYEGPLTPFGPFAADEPWPKASFKEAAQFDPFVRAAWATIPETTPEEIAAAEDADAKKLEELRNAQSAIILTAGSQRIAIIGEHEFHVGDVIGRFTIAGITASGVVLAERDDLEN